MPLDKFSIFQNENYIDLGLYQSGREKCSPGHIFGPAKRNHYLFHYVYSGKGMLMADTRDGYTERFEIYAGQGFLIFPGQITTYVADAHDPWDYGWIEFDGLRVKEALELTNLSRENPVYHTHTPELRDDMAKELDIIIHHCGDFSTLKTIGHLYFFFDDLIQSCRLLGEKKSSRLSDFYVKEAISYIEQNYHKNITVEEIAHSLGIDRSYFGKLFKKNMGKSPQQFLINYRMVKAAELLKTTQLSIGEIAQGVGYENQLHFSRAFKSAYGVSPREWRKTH